MKLDMEHPCWEGEHYPVVVASAILWVLYAVGYPTAVAILIARDKLAAHQQNETTGYWHSTRPLVEKFWFPMVSHLQPKFWWFFLVEFFRAHATIVALCAAIHDVCCSHKGDNP